MSSHDPELIKKQSPPNDPLTTGAMSPRSLLTWCFLIVSISYILYSTDLLFTSRIRGCPPSNIVSFSLSNSTTPTIQQDQQQEEETNTTTTTTTLQDLEEEEQEEQEQEEKEEETKLNHIAFCIAASSNLWDRRKEYIKQWWRPRSTRGVVWLDKRVRTQRNEGLPDIHVSSDTSKFPYKHPHGSRSALRISRIVSETVRMGLKDVRWLVMGDDDTVFVVDNVVRVLAEYDHRQYYYIGSPSESHVQNLVFSYGMAYGGGGFAISYPLAVELERMQDRCLSRYANLYGSDDRIHACMAELGVPLTRQAGFHQYDVYGDLLGLLAAHPVAPFISLHHLDVVEPIFPSTSRADAVRRLFQSINLDSASILQQSICYDKKRWWSISVSWGYVVQISRGLVSPRELEIPTRTFLNWYRRANYLAYSFNTRPVARQPCQHPFTYYITTIRYDKSKQQTVSTHKLRKVQHPACRWKGPSPATIQTVVVFKKPDPLRWQKSPRRDCCRVLPSGKGSTMHISVGNCKADEFSEL